MSNWIGSAVHPRVCGEQYTTPPRVNVCHGSSPRVRGTVEAHCLCDRKRRFIPACAGNSSGTPRYWTDCPVHPRVCGEQLCNTCQQTGHRGSSPRVRGTDCPDLSRVYCRRFIPACAGNRSGKKYCTSGAAVHPRVCGEQIRRTRFKPENSGSSPRVRGTAPGERLRLPTVRFIPACAGNSCDRVAEAAALAVHPRVCGEQRVRQYLRNCGRGSSPRVRGTDSRT